jgi:D-alanyl-D-alanine carboxypeptidase
MKKLIFLIVILITFSCRKSQIVSSVINTDTLPWTDSSFKHPKNLELKQLLTKYNSKGLPGISLLVKDNNGTWFGAIGKADIENDIDFLPGTVSKSASITKLIMGVLMFKLMEDSLKTGLSYTSLQKPIKTWLPKRIIENLPNGEIITLGQCMKHETGIPDVIDQDAFYLAVLNQPNKKWKQEELLSFIYDKKPLFYPSDTAIYSNSNTILVTLVMEAVTSKNHADLLKEYIINPLGLKRTYYQPHDVLPNITAQGYFDLYNNNTIVNVSNLITGSGNGYGGIFSNIFDLYTFYNALFITKTLITTESFSIMGTYGKRDGDNQYGYGIMKSFLDMGLSGYGHKGRDVGYTANLFHFPDKNVGHIFLINYGTDGKSKLRDTFYDFQKELVQITVK